MRDPMRPLTLALVGLLCLMPAAYAQTVDGAGSAALDSATGASDLSAEKGKASATADAATDEATGGLQADAAHADPESEDGFWAWLSLSFNAFLERLGEALGADAPGLDGGANVHVGEDGVEVDAAVGDVKVEGPHVGGASGKTDAVDGKVGETRGKVEGVAPGLPALG